MDAVVPRVCQRSGRKDDECFGRSRHAIGEPSKRLGGLVDLRVPQLHLDTDPVAVPGLQHVVDFETSVVLAVVVALSAGGLGVDAQVVGGSSTNKFHTF